MQRKKGAGITHVQKTQQEKQWKEETSRHLVAEVADDMCAAHCVHDDKQGADSDDAAVGKAAKRGGGCENVTLGENNSEKQKNWDESPSPNCGAGDDHCGAKSELPRQRVV